MNSIIIFGAKYLIFIILFLTAIFFILQSSQTKKQMIILAVITLPASYIIAKLLGHFYYNPRPFEVLNKLPLVSHLPVNGFPSEHTLLSSAVAFVVYAFNKKWGIGLFTLAIIVGISRVFALVHHPIDIIGSLLITSIVTAVSYYFIKKHSKNFKQPA